jgi:glutamine amidotransferase
MEPTIAVLDYGSGNLHSVARALACAGGRPLVTREPGAVRDAAALLIPGVGHFGACLRQIAHHGLDEVIRERVAAGVTVMGVCVGMQVLYASSDEDDEPGLGILAGRVRRLPETVKVPHMGWNVVTWRPDPLGEGVDEGTRFYFVHSFAPDPDEITIGVSDHGRPFAAAVRRGNVLATQFHPEKSGAAGIELYRRFVAEVRTA